MFSLSSIFSFLMLLNFCSDDETNLLCCSLHSNMIENNYFYEMKLCLENFVLES